MTDKRLRTFILIEEQFNGFITGDVETTLAAVKAELELLEDLADGESITITIKRQDMTQAELDAAPVQ